MAAKPHSLLVLPQSSRIRARRDFIAAQQKSRRVLTPHFVFLVALRADPTAPVRLGITASKQVGNAVMRNRAKRLVREAFRTQRIMLPQGVDLVVIVRPGTHRLHLVDVITEWAKIHHVLARHARR